MPEVHEVGACRRGSPSWSRLPRTLRQDLKSHFTYEEIEMTEPLGLLGLGIWASSSSVLL